jgi:SnoaL-like domain
MNRVHPTCTERPSLNKECGWKGGDRGGLAQREQFGKRRNKEKERKKQKNGRKALTLTGLLMEGPILSDARLIRWEPMQANPAQLRDFAAHYTAAWCSQDPARVAGFYSPGGSLAVNNDLPAVGRSAITEVAQSFMTAFPDMRLVMDKVLVRRDRVEYHWTLIGTNTGPGGAGHRVRISGFELWQIGADGLIASSQGHFHSSKYHRQLVRGVQEPR